TADTPAELVTRQQAGTDRPELADWTGQGAIVGIQGGTEQVRNTLAELQEASTQVAGVWLQDWTGQRTTSFGDRLWWTWQLDTDRYPGWADLVADLDAEGIAVTTYVNPFLVGPPTRTTHRSATCMPRPLSTAIWSPTAPASPTRWTRAASTPTWWT